MKGLIMNYISELNCKEKISILNQVLEDALKHHPMGNYISLNGVDMPWGIDNRPYCHRIWIDVYKNNFQYDRRIETKYDYSLTADENIYNLYEKAQEYIYNKYGINDNV